MNKPKVTLKDLFDLPGAVIYNPDDYKPTPAVAIDSRSVKKGAIFFAIKGEKLDGHNFVRSAIKNGAGAVVIHSRNLNRFNDISIPLITVENTTTAYGNLARTIRRKGKWKVISLTGSNGKTTTKEMLYTILSEKYKVSKSEANNNNHIGVPLSIFNSKYGTEILLLEHGTNHFGEIKYTADIAEPDFSLITNIGNAHTQYLINKEKTYIEKSELFNSTIRHKGKVFINNDDEIISKRTKNITNKITYGLTKQASFMGKILGFSPEGYPKVSIKNKKINLITTIPLLGETSSKNFIASVAVASELGLSKKQIISGAKKLYPFNSRLQPVFLKNLMLIDDTYNSSPDSNKAALKLLSSITKYKYKVVILGDMLELGKESEKFHKDLGPIIKQNKINQVLLLGKYMKSLERELIKSKMNVKHFTKRNLLVEHIDRTDFSNSVVLVKGSNRMKMKEFVEQIRNKEV